MVIGYNEQWTYARPGIPYLYGGAVGGVPLPSEVVGALQPRLDALVAETGLLGLNGLDFIVDEDRWLALELNPRPTATLDLYDPGYPSGLFAMHLEACEGNLPPASAPAIDRSRAHAIVHAPSSWQVPESFAFPSWCRDIPMPGVRFGPGDPVCSVHADGESPSAARSAVEARRLDMIRVLEAAPEASLV
jgi:predicted ATP-grasp superfamily ATP-dependent carboligase